MRKIHIFLIVILMLATLSLLTKGCGGKAPPEPNRYYNKKYNFSIIFPKGWEIYESKSEDEPAVEAVSPWESDPDMFSEFIDIYVDELPSWMHLDDYYREISINSRNELAHYQEEDSGTITINNRNAKWTLFSYTIAEGAMQGLTYLMIKDNQAFIITCNTEPYKYQKFKKISKILSIVLNLNRKKFF